jgi:hypothetical protein
LAAPSFTADITDLAYGVVFSIFASYIFSMTPVPLFCAKFIHPKDEDIAKVEDVIRHAVAPADFGMIVSNIGVTADLSAIYTSNSAMDTAFVQVSLKEGHETGSYVYIEKVRDALAAQMPQLNTYFQVGGLVDSVVNQGLPAPIDIDQAARIEQRFCSLHPARSEVLGA